MKNIHIDDSYEVWSTKYMNYEISMLCSTFYADFDASKVLNRSWKGMYIEWWLHNIGYYLTLPFIKNDKIKALNKRFKDVDLEEHR